MRTRCLTLAAALAALLALPAGAVDAPHDGSFTEGLCQTCHKLHAGGGTLVNQIDNNTTCTTCHNKYAPGTSLRGFPWLTDRQASPGAGGDQHSWTGYAASAATGALPPSHAEMAARVSGGRLQCSTCHDQHAANAANAPRSILTSIPIGAARGEDGNAFGARGNGTLTLASVASGATARGTRLRIRSVAAGGGTFILSHDFGLATPTWFNWEAGTSTWVAGSVSGTGKPYSDDVAVALDDPAVQVAIGANVFAGDYWDFSVSYPFLRASNVNDAMCQDCHRDRVMDHACVEGLAGCVADGSRQFSHPVNQPLNANLRNYDRTPANPDPAAQALLDADGADQAVGDGNSTNDLRMIPGSDLVPGTADDQVGCTTCHSPHNTDSNSLTVDPR